MNHEPLHLQSDPLRPQSDGEASSSAWIGGALVAWEEAQRTGGAFLLRIKPERPSLLGSVIE